MISVTQADETPAASFGIENGNEIFDASSEPYGLIEAAVERAV